MTLVQTAMADSQKGRDDMTTLYFPAMSLLRCYCTMCHIKVYTLAHINHRIYCSHVSLVVCVLSVA